jgi:hypothetical protein
MLMAHEIHIDMLLITSQGSLSHSYLPNSVRLPAEGVHLVGAVDVHVSYIVAAW